MSTHPWITDDGVKRLRQIERIITAKPQSYNQSRWLIRRLAPDTACGTVCCIAGHAVALAGELPRTQDEWSWSKWVSQGADALGITNGACSLFSPHDSWPNPFSGQYALAKSERERACVAVRRIEHFIATGK